MDATEHRNRAESLARECAMRDGETYRVWYSPILDSYMVRPYADGSRAPKLEVCWYDSDGKRWAGSAEMG